MKRLCRFECLKNIGFKLRYVFGLIAVLLFVGCYLCFVFCSFPEERLVEAGRGGSTEILDCNGGLIAWRVDAQDSWRVPVELEKVSPWVLKSIIAAEDQRFWAHCGVDPYALVRAVSQNIRHGRRISGASTITMQVMRLVQPAARNWSVKFREAFQAVQTEISCAKERILELYLNLAPYGGNIVGIEAASRHYFGKAASELSLGEAALLSGIPQSPARFNPRRHLVAALKRRDYVLLRMVETGMASKKEVAAARKEKIQIRNIGVNNQNPRFADYILQLQRNRGGIVRTTIDPAVQTAAEAVTDRKYPELAATGITGLAVVVLDVRDSKLVALIGNADPGNPVSGFINGATAKRQPGSLLKPFLFCSAYEQGLLTPASVVYDVPSAWEQYRPENIDHDYLGAISAEKALQLSRNIPAVKLLEEIGVQCFADKLSQLDLQTAGSVEKYSLSLALGTAEMSLLNLVNAYAVLARGGRFLQLKVFAGLDAGAGNGKQVFTPQAAWLTLRSLCGNSEHTLVWKTGTSWNYRDAWAICVSPRYAVGVWCGNFSGNGNNRLLGARVALPIALEVADSIKPAANLDWPQPQGIATHRVCALSGGVPGPYCRHVREAFYIPGVSPSALCRLHERGTAVAQKINEYSVPEEITANLKISESVNSEVLSSDIRLLSPVADATYFMRGSSAEEDECLRLSSVAESAGVISYYIDDEYIGCGKSGEGVEWAMTPGYHKLVAAAKECSVRTFFLIKKVNEL